MAIERTFVMVKPDGVQRGLVGEIINRFEKRGLKLVALKIVNASEAKLAVHYKEHVGKGFYPGLVAYITSGPVVQMVLEGPNAIAAARTTIGKTKAHEAEAGSIRGDLALDISMNLVHGSDGEEAAAHEISVWFNDDEILPYVRGIDAWLTDGR
jgi:nucleoside-diphosphate kinase